MRTTKSTPKWAIDLTEQVCKDYKRALPQLLQWYQRDGRKSSSGVYWKRNTKLHISAGHDVLDQQLVLLHELAHHITEKRKRQGHTIKFWRTAFALYERYGVGLEYGHKREKSYKQKATWAYQEALAKK